MAGVQPQVYGSLPEAANVTFTSTSNTLDPEEAATSQASQGDMTSKIHAFNNQRKEERLRMYSFVIWVFKVQIFCGQFFFVFAMILRAVLAMRTIALVIVMFAMFNTASSIVVLSTCPHDLLNLDEMAKRMPKTVVAFGAALTLLPLIRVLTVFPHLDGMLVIVTVLIASSTWSRWPSWWPTTTFFLTLHNVVYHFAYGGEYLFPAVNKYEFAPTVQYALFGWHMLMALFISCNWWRRMHYLADKSLARGRSFYDSMYASIVAEGVAWIVRGVTVSLDVKELGALYLAVGAALLIPPIVLLILGRTQLFRIIGQSFDRDGARLRKDGAFIAELLDNIPVNVGQLWWVHRETEDEKYERFDHRRMWQRGTVTEVLNEQEFLVQVRPGGSKDGPGGRWARRLSVASQQTPPPSQRASLQRASLTQVIDLALAPIKMQFPSMNGGKRKEDLLLAAQESLRCVDFEMLTADLCRREDSRNKPELQAKWYGLSRPVRNGEQIDFFMSNSWYDDADTKWKKLCEVAENFRKKNGRYPTIWLDKLCIDQTAITDGLKVLSVNVMACAKLLVLCGDTYMSRLWCIWELFTLFAFVPEAVALQRIEFVFLGDYDEGLKMLSGMASTFHVKSSHCYDPNEEARLLQVIEAVGTDRFNKRIAAMAKLTVTRLEKQRSRSRSVGKTKSIEETDVAEGVAV